MGTSMVSAYGQAEGYVWMAPRVDVRLSKRVTLKGGFLAAGSLLGDYNVYNSTIKSYAPRQAGTRVMAVQGGVVYDVNSHLQVWASVAHVEGFVHPLWMSPSEIVPIDATAVSGGFDYHFDNGAALGMSFSIVRDRAGSMWPLMYGYHPYDSYLWGSLY